MNGEFGLGEATRCSIRALKASEIPHALNSITIFGEHHSDFSFKEFTETNPYRFNLVHINAEGTDILMEMKGRHFFENKYNIGFWFWEMTQFPEKWLSSFKHYNEIWVASKFCQEILLKVSPIPVVKVILPISMDEQNPERKRTQFRLPEEGFIFLLQFDFSSIFERKNPLAVIEAFGKAFEGSSKATLVIKSINAHLYPSKILMLRDAAGDKNVYFIDERFSTQDMHRLIAASDCYVSLHRTEGFGLARISHQISTASADSASSASLDSVGPNQRTVKYASYGLGRLPSIQSRLDALVTKSDEKCGLGMAQAVYLNKPVIATGYSGNMDFMNEKNSFLVNYKMVELTENIYPYERGSSWAQPDVNHAAELMRLVFQDRKIAQKKAR